MMGKERKGLEERADSEAGVEGKANRAKSGKSAKRFQKSTKG